MAIGEGTKSANQARHDHVATATTVGFLTDATLCIGCKACEVACKEWNGVPSDGNEFLATSYDNTGGLGASSWRAVKFVEVGGPNGREEAGEEADPLAWLFLSDVCRHCENAGCLEACPTGAIVRTEVGSVFVQDDVCNGCGYCVVSCPFGVIDRRQDPLPGSGGAYKCTLCYDRQQSGLVPACAQACPTESIQFGPLADLRKQADERIATLHRRGATDASIYDPRDSSVGGLHALSIVRGDPAAFGLPRDPVVPTVHLRAAWTSAVLTAAACTLLAFVTFATSAA